MNNANCVKVMFVDMAPVGSLQIFGLCSQQEVTNVNLDLLGKIYWTDYLSGQPIGPFKNVYEAAQNHVNTILSRRAYKDQVLFGNNPVFPETPKIMVDAPVKNNITNIMEWNKRKGRKT